MSECHQQIFKVTAKTIDECKNQLLPLIEAWRDKHPDCEIDEVSQQIIKTSNNYTLVLSTEYTESEDL